MSSTRKNQDSPAKTLRDLSSIQENRFCFDCGQRCPTYVNISIGSFVCTGCGGALRKYNQRVKSISMSNFNSQEINFIKRRGNKACGKIYLALCNGIEPDIRNSNLDDYLRLKYQVQKWYRSPDPDVEEEALKENEAALSRLSQNPTTKPNHVSVNAAAGLIIMNNRPSPAPLPKPIDNSVSNAMSTSNVSPKQSVPSLFSTAPAKEEKAATFDPFADFVAARPATVVSQSVNQLALFAQPSGMTAVSASPSFLQPVQTHSFSAQSIPLASDFFTASSQPAAQSSSSASSSYLIGSAFNPPPPATADRYAALAELDRMGKANESINFTTQSPNIGNLSSVAVGSMKPPQRNPFGTSAYNPFQPPAPDGNNPFASIQSNTTAADSANFASPLGQNYFNPFVNAR
ncbi:hypothetical protein Aperf_G00000043466 [Anoplocephala perfoliata]